MFNMNLLKDRLLKKYFPKLIQSNELKFIQKKKTTYNTMG